MVAFVWAADAFAAPRAIFEGKAPSCPTRDALTSSLRTYAARSGGTLRIRAVGTQRVYVRYSTSDGSEPMERSLDVRDCASVPDAIALLVQSWASMRLSEVPAPRIVVEPARAQGSSAQGRTTTAVAHTRASGDTQTGDSAGGSATRTESVDGSASVEVTPPLVVADASDSREHGTYDGAATGSRDGASSDSRNGLVGSRDALAGSRDGASSESRDGLAGSRDAVAGSRDGPSNDSRDGLVGSRDSLAGARDGVSTGARDGLTGSHDSGSTGSHDGVTGSRGDASSTSRDGVTGSRDSGSHDALGGSRDGVSEARDGASAASTDGRAASGPGATRNDLAHLPPGSGALPNPLGPGTPVEGGAADDLSLANERPSRLSVFLFGSEGSLLGSAGDQTVSTGPNLAPGVRVESGLTPRFSLGLQGRSEAQRARARQPGFVTADLAAIDLTARYAFHGPAQSGAELLGGLGLQRILASSANYSVSGSRTLFDAELVGYAGWHQNVGAGFYFTLFAGGELRAQTETLEIAPFGTIMTLPPIGGRAGIGLGWSIL